MSTDHERFRINDSNVVAEELDGEVVAVNLESGTYFSMSGSAGAIWEKVLSGASAPEIAAELLDEWAGVPPEVAEITQAFLGELISHGLIVSDDRVERYRQPTANERTRGDFVPPQLGVHADLQDILLLDPVHDVDATGWPIAADPASDTWRSSP